MCYWEWKFMPKPVVRRFQMQVWKPGGDSVSYVVCEVWEMIFEKNWI